MISYPAAYDPGRTIMVAGEGAADQCSGTCPALDGSGGHLGSGLAARA